MFSDPISARRLRKGNKMSQFLEYIKIAVMNIRSNRARSFLTMLGIIIGITSVILIITVGNGVKDEIGNELNSLGQGSIYLGLDSKKTDQQIEQADLDALQEAVPEILGTTPSSGQLMGSAVTTRGTFDATLIPVGTGYAHNGSEKVVMGRYFNQTEVDNASPVCVMTQSDAKKLFGTTDVIGMTVEIDCFGLSQDYTIIGLRSNSTSKLLGAVMANDYLTIEVPYTSVLSYGYDMSKFDNIIVYASQEDSKEVAEKSVAFLESRFSLRGEKAITMQSFSDTMSQFNQILNYITMFITMVAAVSLLVGGIGVMNIMLVSVTERTREIGIRKALGARTGSILLQFLAEAGIITMMGGIIGILLGVGISYGIGIGFDFKISLSPLVILLTVVFSSAVGIFFGIYPAKKAAKLSPIEALRHD